MHALLAIYRRLETRLLSSPQDEPLLRPVMPELDTIRGVAILMVLVSHGFLWSKDAALPLPTVLVLNVALLGRLGVNLFFVLSGFLITGLLFESVGRAGYYRRFYRRRAARILPAFYLTLLILKVTDHAPGSYLGLSAVFLANLTPLFGVWPAYGVLWSLAVEEHFYLIWPTLVRHLTARRLLYLCAAIVVVEPALRAVSFATTAPHGVDGLDVMRYTWNAIDAIALGSFLALAVREFRWDRQTAVRYALGTIAAGAAVFCAGIPLGIASRHGTGIGAAFQEVPWNFAFAGVLALFLVLGTGRWKRLVVPPALRFFGRISYGLYLIHFLLFDKYDAIATRYFPRLLPSAGQIGLLSIRFLIASAAAIVAAWISRETFEHFFLTLGRQGIRTTLKSLEIRHGKTARTAPAYVVVDDRRP